MKILNRKQFLELPGQVLFSKYEPCVFGDLTIKSDTMGNDFLVQYINSSIKCKGSDFADILENAEDTGGSIDIDLDSMDRDGCFNNNQLFAVWEEKDVRLLIARLQELLTYEDIDLFKKDAERYRKLREIALKAGKLESTVALGQFDFISTSEKFDEAVDSL